ncbi:hypothetical protein BDW62DRAFT_17552 [Aspergillus aurantiobrunneus]
MKATAQAVWARLRLHILPVWSRRRAGTASSRLYGQHLGPTLGEVLADTTRPPYTLSGFIAYLSTKQCLENVTFILKAREYRELHRSLHESGHLDGPTKSMSVQRLDDAWRELLSCFLSPDGPLAVNYPRQAMGSSEATGTKYLPSRSSLIQPWHAFIHWWKTLCSCNSFIDQFGRTPWGTVAKSLFHNCRALI